MRFDCVPIPQPSAPPPSTDRGSRRPARRRDGPVRCPEVPVRIGRDEAQRRAAEELAKAKYGGTPQWLLDLAERADGRAAPGGAVPADLRRPGRVGGVGINWGFVVVVAAPVWPPWSVVWRVGLPRWRGGRRDAAVELDPTRAAADYRTAAEQAAPAATGPGRCGTVSGRSSASWRCRPSSTSGRPGRRPRPPTAHPRRCRLHRGAAGAARRASTRWSTATGRPPRRRTSRWWPWIEQVTAAAARADLGPPTRRWRPDEARDGCSESAVRWVVGLLFALTLVVLGPGGHGRPGQPAAGRRPPLDHAVRRGRARPCWPTRA